MIRWAREEFINALLYSKAVDGDRKNYLSCKKLLRHKNDTLCFDAVIVMNDITYWR